jgi:hypothetical protein
MPALLKSNNTSWIRIICAHLAKPISFRSAVGVSLILHVGLAFAATALLLSKHLMAPAADEVTLPIELITTPEIEVENPPITEKPLYDRFQSEDPGTNQAAENQVAYQQARLLASLSGLKESFNFISQPVIADSTSGFTLIMGSAPDVQALYESLMRAREQGKTGRGTVIGVGSGGNCPPKDGGIAK